MVRNVNRFNDIKKLYLEVNIELYQVTRNLKTQNSRVFTITTISHYLNLRIWNIQGASLH